MDQLQLQRDIHQVAVAGQTLLARHEAYVAEAEARNAADATAITALQTQITSLESDNKRLCSENEELSTNAEALNAAVDESEKRISTLNAALKDTQYELSRMRVFAARAEDLEQQLSKVELDCQLLQDTVRKTEKQEAFASARWRSSERIIGELESTVEQMEAEARVLRENQVIVNARAEREKSMDNTVKSQRDAAVREGYADDVNSLTSFINTVLQDNAGLRMDMADMRDCLIRSQAETEELRSQVTFASPRLPSRLSALDLSSELQSQLALLPTPDATTPQPHRQNSYFGPQEIHIHHHTHLASAEPAALSMSLPSAPTRSIASARHRRQLSSRSSVFKQHSRTESAASSIPSTLFESDTGYETDFTNLTHSSRPFSPESDTVEGAASVYTPKAPPPLSPLKEDIYRPTINRSHASSTRARTFAPGESAAGQALRERLQERKQQTKHGGYNPLKDTFGGIWGTKAKKRDDGVRRQHVEVITEVVDEEGLKECLAEEVNE